MGKSWTWESLLCPRPALAPLTTSWCGLTPELPFVPLLEGDQSRLGPARCSAQVEMSSPAGRGGGLPGQPPALLPLEVSRV